MYGCSQEFVMGGRANVGIWEAEPPAFLRFFNKNNAFLGLSFKICPDNN